MGPELSGIDDVPLPELFEFTTRNEIDARGPLADELRKLREPRFCFT
jgi:hypothetical protein